MEVKIKLSAEAAQVIRNTDQLPANMRPAIMATMDKQNELTANHIIQDYLSFPSSEPPVDIGCRAVTTRLRKSLRASKTEESGGRYVSAIGSNVVYAAAQEFGFEGEETVSPHMRRQVKRETHFGLRRNVQKADIGVRSYTRHMHIKGRGFVQRGLADRAGDYSTALSKAIVEAWNKKSP